jgi:uncharacterized protein YndB with AHSA1/START domain
MLVGTVLVVAALALVLWLPLPPRDLTRIVDVIDIERPPADVFAYVSTPGNWPKWHPSSLAVRGAVDHSLGAGEQVTETFLVAGRRGEVVWTVAASEPPARWIIAGKIDGRAAGRVVYTLTATAHGTRFQREFTYTSPNLLFAVTNRLLVRRRIEQESTEAVRRLKQNLETGGMQS